MKKFVKYLFVICLIVPCAFLLAGCGEGNKPANVMRLDVNPEVSFVLDNNNKVVSVQFEDGSNGNGDAGTIFADVNFVGKDVNATIQIFIERATISGKIDFNGEEITVEINGKNNADVEKLKQQVQTQVQDVFNSLGAQVSVTFNKITEEAQRQALEAKALLLAPEKTSSDIKDMSNEQLVELISDKQKEYQDLAYSQVKAISTQLASVEQAALNSAKELFEQAEEALNKAQQALDEASKVLGQEALAGLQSAVDKAQTTFNTQKANFEAKVNAFLQKKAELISQAKAKYESVKAQLVDTYKSLVASSETAVKAHLDQAKQQGLIDDAQYNYWVSLIDSQKPSK